MKIIKINCLQFSCQANKVFHNPCDILQYVFSAYSRKYLWDIIYDHPLKYENIYERACKRVKYMALSSLIVLSLSLLENVQTPKLIDSVFKTQTIWSKIFIQTFENFTKIIIYNLNYTVKSVCFERSIRSIFPSPQWFS